GRRAICGGVAALTADYAGGAAGELGFVHFPADALAGAGQRGAKRSGSEWAWRCALVGSLLVDILSSGGVACFFVAGKRSAWPDVDGCGARFGAGVGGVAVVGGLPASGRVDAAFQNGGERDSPFRHQLLAFAGRL